MFVQLLINGIITGSIIGLVALGFSIVYNTTRIFHIAYAVIYTFAPYIFFSLHIKSGLSFALSVFIALATTILLSVIVEVLVYQPMNRKKSSLNQLLISSIGIMIIVTNLIALFFGNEIKLINPVISDSISIGGMVITYNQIYQVIISCLLIVGFFIFLKFSKFGIITRALHDDEYLCKVFAVNIKVVRIAIFAISGFFAAVAGILVAYDVGMDPYVGMPMFLNAFVALIIGGAGKFHTPVIGGFIIGLLQSLIIYFFSANWSIAATFLLLIIFLLVRPQGLAGELQRTV